MNRFAVTSWRAGMLIVAVVARAVSAQPVAAMETAATRLVHDATCDGGDPTSSGVGPKLDLYGPERAAGPPRPIVLFVHGGGWRHGDKAHVGDKPAAFVSRGFLFASVGYRLDPPVTPRDQAADVAAAVAWLHEHARKHGGDGDAIFLVTVHEPDKTHLTLNRELGVAGDGPTEKILQFLAAR